jgi:hypothetical protein
LLQIKTFTDFNGRSTVCKQDVAVSNYDVQETLSHLQVTRIHVPRTVVVTTCGNIHVDKERVQVHADSSAALRNTSSGGPWHKFSCDKEERRQIMASEMIRN